MRAIILSVITTILFAAPTLAAESGAFASSQAANAAACAQRCADDGLCMMWVYRPQSLCELKAVVVSSVDEALAAGVSPRAPQFARTTTIAVVAPPPPPAPPAPAPHRQRHPELALLGGLDESRNGLRPRLGDAQ